MRSPQIESSPYLAAPEKAAYSDLLVLRSTRGWYVGTQFQNFDHAGNPTFLETGSRDTAYFETEAEARAFLARLEAGDEQARAKLRMEP